MGVRGSFQAKIDTNIKQGEHTINKDFFWYLEIYKKNLFAKEVNTEVSQNCQLEEK